MERVEESRLIERVLAGDPAAERTLYDAHVDRIFRLCWRLADGDDALAREFTQDTFVRAFERLPRFERRSALSTWLHTIAVSVSLNGMRRVRRVRRRETSIEGMDAAAPSVPRADPALRAKLREAIRMLPERYRVVFLMFEVEGYTHGEIGRVLDVAEGTSKARLSRARAKLRAALAEYEGEWAT